MSRIHERSRGRCEARGRGLGRARGVVVSALALAAVACGRDADEPVLVLRAEPPTQERRSPASETPEGGVAAVAVVSQAAPPASSASGGRPVVEMEQASPRRVTYEEAESVFREGRWVEATDLFGAYVDRVPTNPWGHYMLGLSAWRAGDLDRAEGALRRTVELSASHGKGRLNLARVLLERGRPAEALEPALRVVELLPEGGEGWRVLGNVHAELGGRDEAIAAYTRAIVLDPDDAWSLNNLGLLRIRMGDHRGALGPLARATELMPEVALFQNNYGAALERGGYLTEAAEAFQAALDADPGHERARTSLARVEARGPSTPLLSVELSEISSLFTAELERWQSEGRAGGSHEHQDGPGGLDL